MKTLLEMMDIAEMPMVDDARQHKVRELLDANPDNVAALMALGHIEGLPGGCRGRD